jgi:PAS domain S-box-containing protein
VLEDLQDAVLAIGRGAADGQVLYANNRASALFGYEPGGVVGLKIQDLVPHWSGVVAAPDADASTSVTIGAARTLVGCRRDHSVFPVNMQLASHLDPAMPFVMAVACDISEPSLFSQLRARMQRSVAQVSQVHSQLLAAIDSDGGCFPASGGSLGALLRGVLDGNFDARVHDRRKEAAARTEQVRGPDGEVRHLSGDNAAQEFPLRETLARLRAQFGPMAASKSISFKVPDSDEIVRCDPTLFNVALVHLVGRAVDTTQEGFVQVAIHNSDEVLSIEIADSGSGVSSAELQSGVRPLDAPNRRAGDHQSALTPAIPLARFICQLLGARITVDSRPGDGTTVTMDLARGAIARQEVEHKEARTLVGETAVGKYKVLHIEDDPDVVRSMRMLLRLEGYDVVAAASGDEAMSQVSGNGFCPDVILCDYHLLQGPRGDMVMAELAPLLARRTPTIMLTGDVLDEHLIGAQRVSDRVLSKPVDAGVLLQEITSLLRSRN